MTIDIEQRPWIQVHLASITVSEFDRVRLERNPKGDLPTQSEARCSHALGDGLREAGGLVA